MYIAILHPSYEGSAAPFKGFDPFCDPSRYLPGPIYTHVNVAKATAVRQVSEIARLGVDVAINLCDGAWDEDRPGIEVVQTLERLNIAFTGAGSTFYEPSREAMKMACHSAGGRFPPYVRARRMEDAERALARLRFPMIVKHRNSYSSIGLTRDSRVTDAEALRREVSRFLADYGGALIEEFIEGREFTVLVAEARDPSEEAWALEPIEFVFPEGESFKHFDLKWKEFGAMTTRAVGDAPLRRRLQEAAALTFAALGGSGYGRCDLRVDERGQVYLLEINPNCAVFYPDGQFGSADLILARDPAGHRGFLEHLLACAVRRREGLRRPWEVQFDRVGGFGMFATSSIRAGEVVERYEERAHVLASRGYVDRQWRGLRRRWFEQYAWPLSNDVHVLWSDNPDDWRPINHSCDPNTWLEGLDLVARRDIAAGDELTIDYASFCGPSMSPFECACRAAECRRVILASDHMLPAVRARYGDHVSDFVRAAWRSIAPDWRPALEVVPNALGVGAMARRAWRAGDAISPLTWTAPQSEPSKWTVQCGPGAHAEPLPFELRYVNHSCRPNVHFDVDGGVLRALRDIEPGDELGAFYPATEWDLAVPFDCRCGADACLGHIEGASRIPVDVLERYTLSEIVRQKLAGARAVVSR